MPNKKEIATIEKMDLSQIEKKAGVMQTMVEATKVTTDEELSVVADQIKQIKMLGKYIKAEMEKYTKPAQMIINEARTKYLPYEKICASAESQLKAKASVYMQEQEAIRRKKEESIAKRAEAGQLKEETAIRKMEEIGEAKTSISTDTSQMQMRTVREAIIIDPNKVPDEYWIIDEPKVKKVALAGINIPGVEIQEKKQIAIR